MFTHPPLDYAPFTIQNKSNKIVECTFFQTNSKCTGKLIFPRNLFIKFEKARLHQCVLSFTVASFHQKHLTIAEFCFSRLLIRRKLEAWKNKSLSLKKRVILCLRKVAVELQRVLNHGVQTTALQLFISC